MTVKQRDPQQADLAEEIVRVERWERERDRLKLAADAAGKLDTIQERVAWVLNHYPETRDSDRVLWFRYWSVFESDNWDGRSLTLEDAYRVTHPGSLTRARAKIQNDYRLFQASAAVREHRGKLSETEREKAVTQNPPVPLFSVYADESGKNSDHLIVAGAWFLHGPEIIKIRQAIDLLKQRTGYQRELHFKDIDDRNLSFYLDAAGLIAAESAALSLKAITVERRGIRDQDSAFEDLLYHLLIRGVQHEDRSGRAPLPRRIALTKDLEEVGRDKILLANLRDRVAQAGESIFGGRLEPTEFVFEESHRHQVLQIADLFAGSLNRLLNVPGSGPKDEFSRRFLELVGMADGPEQQDQAGDLAVRIAL